MHLLAKLLALIQSLSFKDMHGTRSWLVDFSSSSQERPSQCGSQIFVHAFNRFIHRENTTYNALDLDFEEANEAMDEGGLIPLPSSQPSGTLASYMNAWRWCIFWCALSILLASVSLCLCLGSLPGLHWQTASTRFGLTHSTIRKSYLDVRLAGISVLQEVFSFLEKASQHGLEVVKVEEEQIPEDLRVPDVLVVHLRLKSRNDIPQSL